MKQIETDITCRLDALPWTSFHWRFLFALGITWVLDAFEVVIVTAVLRSMTSDLGITKEQSSLVISSFLVGTVLGSLVFGYLADRWGRKKLFLLTLLLYSGGTFLTGFATDLWSVLLFRLMAGAGLGGEFTAIQSAIDEFVPARHRGKVDGTITALWNLGSLMASLTTLYLLRFLGETGWRWAFLLGGVIALLAFVVRLYVPESPRWLIAKGRLWEAERIVSSIESYAGVRPNVEKCMVPVYEGSLWDATRLILSRYRWRFLFSASMSFTILTTYYGMQALLPIVLTEVYGLKGTDVPSVLMFGSVGGLLGGLVVAYLSDRIGRKVMGLAVSFCSLMFSSLFLVPIFDLKTTFFLYSLVGYSFASVAYVLATEIYPSPIRAYAIGLMSLVGRVSGSFVSPLLVAVSQQDYRLGVIGLASLWMVGFTAFFLYTLRGKETRGRSLEDIS
ncbi:major facilitator superfamily MFS_1 [Thermocrinis albus DSM 14484]|uniref:Major facilitator superfamily MFS_1 n=1 Tax=Thermocrinis albus (strain DSM 14484 / JCM 11386 / HI 11/12) TaxID=638303 RepID=D3SM92_THEAH|nr:MFS transporter [Thermocrinis albus]ADC89872.1 major facilitator superfamily MFS_1 [Thermocrinis albus DSM 14484]